MEWVLLHGCPGNAAGWEALVAVAPPGVSVTAFEFVDVGSREAPAASLEDLVTDTVRFVQGRSAPVVLVGHSFGAWVAGHVAARSPGSVAALVLAAGYPAASPEVAAELEAIAGMFDAGQTPLAAWVDLVSARWLDPEAPDALRRRDIEALLASESSPRIARALRRAAQAQTPVPRSPVPTLVLAAEDDAAVPAARARELAQSLDARFESWPGRSHFLHWRDPVAFVRRVEAFAASVAAP